jgi:multisubunit Na+/H+ antiporter MnhC subunit
MIFIPLLFIAGIYCLVVTRNLLRALIGLELLTKGATLLIILAGHVTGRLALTQSLVITLIVIEVVVAVVAAGVILNIFRHHNSLDTKNLRHLKG